MNLEQAIHERWAADTELCEALPVARLYTGLAPGSAAAPYAVLTELGRRPQTHTSSGTVLERVTLRFTSWTATLAAGRRLGEAIAAQFNRRDFALDVGRVLNMERVNEQAQQQPDGAWRIELDYAVTVEHAGS